MVLRWRRSALWWDLARVTFAVFVCFLGALTFPWFTFPQFILGSFCLIFGVYLFDCMVKLVSEITVDDKGVSLSRKWLPTLRVNWENTQTVEVRHFSLGLSRKRGLMDVKVKGPQATILIDDGIDRFPELLQLIWTCAKQYGIDLSDTSKINLSAAGCLAPTDR